jgi:hypothetical protein
MRSTRGDRGGREQQLKRNSFIELPIDGFISWMRLRDKFIASVYIYTSVVLVAQGLVPALVSTVVAACWPVAGVGSPGTRCDGDRLHTDSSKRERSRLDARACLPRASLCPRCRQRVMAPLLNPVTTLPMTRDWFRLHQTCLHAMTSYYTRVHMRGCAQVACPVLPGLTA